MAKQEVPDGVCLICEHASSCCLSSASPQLVQHCEEFSTCKPKAVSTAGSRLAETAPAWRAPYEFTDLCSDCENRRGCGLSGAEGGVWHCEEYK